MKRILTIGILAVAIFTGCQLIDNSNPVIEVSKPISQEERILEVINGDNISYYKQQEIVLLYEINEYLYKNFQITYDEFKDVYNEYLYVGPNIDDEYFAGVQNINFVGLSIEETRDLIRGTDGYDLDWVDEINAGAGENKYLVLVSEVIPGYDDDESSVYVRKEITIPKWVNGAKPEYTTYRFIKYRFKEIDGKFKVFTRSDRYMFDDGMFGEKMSEEELYNELKKFDVFKVDGELMFDYNFDIKDFCEENL